jgi:hypothetical protein
MQLSIRKIKMNGHEWMRDQIAKAGIDPWKNKQSGKGDVLIVEAL